MIIKIDGIGINANHFAGMSEKDAVAKMKADGILDTHGKNDEWAKGVYDECVLRVKGPVAKENKDSKKESKKAVE